MKKKRAIKKNLMKLGLYLPQSKTGKDFRLAIKMPVKSGLTCWYRADKNFDSKTGVWKPFVESR